ncbi:MAG: histidine phosphatase family protein, partial [Actinomycetota bacterium]
LDPRWRENHAGEWQGLTPEEIRAQWPGYLENDRRPPGFEAASSTVARARDALDDIVARHAGTCVLVISHGGVLRLLQTEFTGTQQRFPNLSGSWFEHSEHHGWTMGSLLFPLQRVTPDGTVE